mgnify:CR=1 FL=1
MRDDDVVHEHQRDPRGVRSSRLTSKEPGRFLRRNSRPVVLDGDRDRVWLAREANHDRPAGHAPRAVSHEAKGVADERRDRPRDLLGVHLDARQLVGRLELERHLEALGLLLQRFERAREQRPQIARLDAKRDPRQLARYFTGGGAMAVRSEPPGYW